MAKSETRRTSNPPGLWVGNVFYSDKLADRFLDPNQVTTIIDPAALIDAPPELCEEVALPVPAHIKNNTVMTCLPTPRPHGEP